MTAVRDIALNDEVAWRELWAKYCTFYKIELAEDVTAATWNRIHAPTSPVGALVALVDDAIVGFANYVVHPNTWSAGDVCYLEDLYVEESVRGGGVGGALIDRLVEIGGTQGWNRVYWHTASNNLTARRLYDRYRPADEVVKYSIPL